MSTRYEEWGPKLDSVGGVFPATTFSACWAR